MIRPLTNQVLVRVLPREAEINSPIIAPEVHLSADEVQERNHHPKPPPPDIGIVEAIGPWPRLANGLAVLPDFPPGAKVVFRRGAGQDLERNPGERMKILMMRDVLAVLTEA